MEKTELLSKLYTLRAGLSVIACEEDKVLAIQQSANEKESVYKQKQEKGKTALLNKKEALTAIEIHLSVRKDELEYYKRVNSLVKFSGKELKKRLSQIQ
jgi:hypothetical protein